MSGPLNISLNDELLFIKSLLIPAFDPDNELDTSKKRKEWMRQRAINTGWDAGISGELIIRYGTVASLENAEKKLEEVKAERRLVERAEENERQRASPKASPSTSPPTKKRRKEMLFLMEKLINAVFVDNKRVITTEEDSTIWSLPEDGNVYWDGSYTKRLVIQPQWLELYTALIGGVQTHVLLEGKAGRGKSVFLRYMILRMLEDPAIPNEATFAYVVKVSMSNSRTLWIMKNGFSVNVVNDIPEEPDYLLLDNVDAVLDIRGKKLNLGLTSGDREVLKEFRKRVVEARVLGKYHTMLALDLKAMRLMFPDLPTDDLQFRYD
eukprot:gene15281-17082_t